MSRQVTAIEFCVSKERVGNESVYTNRFALVSITNTVRRYIIKRPVFALHGPTIHIIECGL